MANKETPEQRALSDRRRESLRRLLFQNSITCSELARKAKLTSPNRLYNFLNGHSKSLSLPTLERICPFFSVANQEDWTVLAPNLMLTKEPLKVPVAASISQDQPRSPAERELLTRIDELERLLGKKTLEIELLRRAEPVR